MGIIDAFANWLIDHEAHYGGVQKVPLGQISPYDARSERVLRKKREEGARGGDRMAWHGYARDYARSLIDHFDLDAVGPIRGRHVVVELGVLRGHGLALLCDLFPESRVIGLDLDVGQFTGNCEALRTLGAFAGTVPEIHAFDELAPDASARLQDILAGDAIDVFIDDAAHYDDAVLRAFEVAGPSLRQGYLYFIEDNATARQKLSVWHRPAGLLTILSGAAA